MSDAGPSGTGAGAGGLGGCRSPDDVEASLRTLAELCSIPFYCWDPLRGLGWQSRHLDSLVGARADQQAFPWWLDLVHPEDRDRVRTTISTSLEKAAPGWSVDYRLRGPDGSYRSVRDHAFILRDAGAESQRVFGAIEEHASPTLGPRNLDTAESQLRAIIENSPNVAIEAYDRDGRVLAWNPAAERIFGWSADEALGRTLDQLILDDAATELFLETLREIERTGRPADPSEWTFERRDGSTGAVYSTIFPIVGSRADVQFICMDVDVTDRLHAQSALRESEERFRSAFENAPIGMALVDLTGAYLQVNDQFAGMLGYAREELLGKRFHDLTHPDDLDSTDAIRREMIDSPPRRVQFEKRFVASDGGIVEVLITSALHCNPDGVPQYFISHIQDVTERKRDERERERLYRKAMEADRRKDEFLATVSHELRTPLTPILGWAGVLARGSAAPELVVKGAHVIERSAGIQARLIDDLLEISRIVAGQERIELSPLSLEPVVLSALETARSAALSKEIELTVEVEPQLPPILGDPQRLEQICWNLLSNALKFTPRGGKVSVLVTRDQDEVTLTVADNGCGIEPDFLPFVFERFRQAEGPATRTHGGLGLGLAIVHHLVELHGGRVEAHSEGAGRGATFTVTLPAIAAPETEQVEAGARRAAPSLEGVTVLLVEDDPQSQEVLAEVLEIAGAQVLRADSASTALSALRAQWPDLLVADIVLPGQDGAVLLEKALALARDHGRTLPAIAISALASSADQERARSAGFSEYLVKPIRPEQVLAAAARQLGSPPGA